MIMRKLFTILIALISAAVVTTAAAYAVQSMGSAKLRQINGSGVRARTSFLDSGSPDDQLIIVGTAKGLDPTKAYVSLVYDNGSAPRGPGACLPSAQNDLTGAQMFVGTWQVDANGNGTLLVTKTGPSYVPVSEIGAMSIRLADTRELQACGEVRPRCKEDEGQENDDR